MAYDWRLPRLECVPLFPGDWPPVRLQDATEEHSQPRELVRGARREAPWSLDHYTPASVVVIEDTADSEFERSPPQREKRAGTRTRFKKVDVRSPPKITWPIGD